MVKRISASSFPIAAPDRIASRAFSTASASVAAPPATNNPAAAFITTISVFAPAAPPRISRVIAAFANRSPPRNSSSPARRNPKSPGCQYCLATCPPSTVHTVVDPDSVISSSPSDPCTRNCRPSPKLASACAISSPIPSPGTPINCACAPAGLHNGPIRFSTVRIFNSVRTGAAWRSAGCSFGANRNPIPVSRMLSPIRSGVMSIFTPNASSTSADPHIELADRFPCLATFTPAPATTNAATVEMLNVFASSPPVPQVSSDGPGPGSTRIISARIARANPVSTSAPTRRGGSSTRKADNCTGETAPARISRIASCASASPNGNSRTRRWRIGKKEGWLSCTMVNCEFTV